MPIYSFSSQKNNDYEVLLKPNDFYTNNILPSGGYYASKSVNEFIINFKYDFKGNKKTNLQYNYNITANLVGSVDTNDNQNKEVWNRMYTLLENKENRKEKTDEFSINEQINIDYEYYNELSRLYEKTYGITIDAILKVRLNISCNINLSDFNLENEKIDDYIELDIPITNTVTEIKENYENITNKDIMPKTQEVKNNKMIYYIIGVILIIVSISVIVIKIKKNSIITPEDMYRKNINHILKYYRDLIVTVVNEPDLSNLKIMKIITLDDLIDVAEQTKNNIIHYEISKNKESKLYVIVNDYVYIYTV